VGQVGTGKTTALLGVARAHEPAVRANAQQGRVSLDRGVTVLHDEAARLDREQAWLLGAVRHSGARLVMIGDPRQSQAVGAGGL
jgi:ATP-dependent exoDNAse (exonuclease V) alpha subunit